MARSPVTDATPPKGVFRASAGHGVGGDVTGGSLRDIQSEFTYFEGLAPLGTTGAAGPGRSLSEDEVRTYAQNNGLRFKPGP